MDLYKSDLRRVTYNRLMRRLPALAGVLLLTATASAVVPSQRMTLAADTLTALVGAHVDKPLRTYRDVAWNDRRGAAYDRFVAHAGGSWEASWDTATGVPTRLFGHGIAAPGANADPAVAEKVARQWLADHLDLLAPGAAASDFELRSNHSDGEIRSLGFIQRHHGLRVVGGQIGFEFKKDRLFVIGSTALPNVSAEVPRARFDHTRAVAAVRTATMLPDAPVSNAGDDVVLPLVGAGGVIGYRVATPMIVDGGGLPGRYLTYVDTGSGAPIAAVQLNRFATGVVQYNGVDRYPERGRVSRPAPNAHIVVGGQNVTTAADGGVTWSPDAQVQLTTAVVGDFVTVQNQLNGKQGQLASTTMPISPGGGALWDASVHPTDDAQVQAFLDTNIVKQFVRDNIDPAMPNLPGAMENLDHPLIANVNINQSCNAFFDGKAINFLEANAKCQNSALVQDVLFHEFGHDLHESEIIEGVGAFDPGMSEGVGDFLAVNMTNDSGLGRGFFYDDEPLRELDPAIKCEPLHGCSAPEWTWPTDIGEIHHTGLIFGGTWWDLRKAFLIQLGDVEGEKLILKLYLGAIRRSVDIPSSLVEALAADDDDGDLSNGTPHECTIRAAFGAHGMTTSTGVLDSRGATRANALATSVKVNVSGGSPRCNENTLGMQIVYGPGETGQPDAGSVNAVEGSDGSFSAMLPLALHGDVLFQANVQFTNGARITLPDNLADPEYQMYSGRTVQLYCTGFDFADPFTEGWTTGTGDDSPTPWAWGTPTAGATDPHFAFSGDKALVEALDGDYAPKTFSYVAMPPIDVGNYSDVRLQYRRWLATEDSHFDQARITANGKEVWINATANNGDSSALQHVDKEWRFQDVPLSGHFSGHTVVVAWEHTSDPGLELGGWALDDVCLVANPDAICGDGIQTATEQCDNGIANADAPDACRSDCSAPKCGDGIVDSGEDCDGGPTGNDTCSSSCRTIEPGSLGGCSTSGGSPAAALGFAVAGIGILVRRRRRV